MNVGNKITNLRKENNLTQEDLAEMLNVSRQTISNWENGKSYPDIATLILISDQFKISLDDLLKDQKMVKVIDKMIKRNTTLKFTCFIIFLITIIFTLGVYVAKKVSPYSKNNYVFSSSLTLDNIVGDDGLIMSIRSGKFNKCVTPYLEIYSDGTYKLYDTHIKIIGEGHAYANLIWGDPKIGKYNYNILKILRNIKERSRSEYEISLGNKEENYNTDSDNQELMKFLNKYGLDLNNCADYINIEYQNDMYHLIDNIYSTEPNPKFMHEGELLSIVDFLKNSNCTYKCLFNYEKPNEVKDNIKIYSYDVLDDKYYLVECGNIYIGKEKEELIKKCDIN